MPQIVVPDSITPVVGWRSWHVVHESGRTRLRSVVWRRHVWPARTELEASCAKAAHESPDDECTCGIYAASKPAAVAPYHNSTYNVATGHVWRVFGRVNLWGRVIEYDRGWRAEYAYPHSIVIPEHSAGDEPLAVAERQALAAELRDAYGIPVVVEIRRPLVRRLLRR